MDDEAGSSRPKRRKVPLNYSITDSNIEDQLCGGDDSYDEYHLEDLDISSDDEEEAADRQYIQRNTAMDLVPLSQPPSPNPSEELQPPESTATSTVM